MRAVCDTCSLIKLRKGGVVDCLGQLFESVLIPLAIKDECQDPETQALLEKDFFKIMPVSHVLPLAGIQKGEREAISLAVEQNISIFITDDEKALTKASQEGLVAMRSVRVLLMAKQKGFIPSIKPILDTMIAQGEGIHDDIYHETLRSAGEI